MPQATKPDRRPDPVTLGHLTARLYALADHEGVPRGDADHQAEFLMHNDCWARSVFDLLTSYILQKARGDSMEEKYHLPTAEQLRVQQLMRDEMARKLADPDSRETVCLDKGTTVENPARGTVDPELARTAWPEGQSTEPHFHKPKASATNSLTPEMLKQLRNVAWASSWAALKLGVMSLARTAYFTYRLWLGK